MSNIVANMMFGLVISIVMMIMGVALNQILDGTLFSNIISFIVGMSGVMYWIISMMKYLGMFESKKEIENYLLIPTLAIWGAILSTIISYILGTTYIYITLKKTYITKNIGKSEIVWGGNGNQN